MTRVTVVDACTRDGTGGSPTAVVLEDGTLTDQQRREIVRAAGTSHGAFVTADDAVRFFTGTGELRNCGHGTIAAQAVLPERRLRAGGRVLDATVVHRPDGIEVWFDQGPVELWASAGDDDLLAALGLDSAELRVASPGTPRLLVRVPERQTLLALRPDFPRLAAACRRRGLLGCFAYALAADGRTATARMFAPAIGVDEDIVNANSTGCLAAHLNRAIEVHQGDALGRPSTVYAAGQRVGGRVSVPVPEAGGRVSRPGAGAGNRQPRRRPG